MNDEALAPYPFCGSASIKYDRSGVYPSVTWFYCKDCIAYVEFIDDGSQDREAAAVAHWNMRSDPWTGRLFVEYVREVARKIMEESLLLSEKSDDARRMYGPMRNAARALLMATSGNDLPTGIPSGREDHARPDGSE